MPACSTSPSSGNQVDGLPLVTHNVFPGPETSYNRNVVDLLIFARILYHDVNTSRTITFRRVYGSSSYFAWCKILPISNEVLCIR